MKHKQKKSRCGRQPGTSWWQLLRGQCQQQQWRRGKLCPKAYTGRIQRRASWLWRCIYTPVWKVGSTSNCSSRKRDVAISSSNIWIARKVTSSSTGATRLHKDFSRVDSTVAKNYRCVLECCETGIGYSMLFLLCSWDQH